MPERSRRLISAIVKWVFAIAVVTFGIAYFVQNGPAVGEALGRLSPALVALALVLALLALPCAFLSWQVLWPAFGADLPLVHGLWVFFVSQTGKYLPGSIWPIAVQASMARRVGLSPAGSVLLSLLAMGVSITVGLGWGGIVSAVARPELLAAWWWLAVIAAALCVASIPPIVRIGIRLASEGVSFSTKLDRTYRRRNWEVQLGAWSAGARGKNAIHGSPTTVADYMEEWFTNGACDGFCIMPPYIPGAHDDFCNLVIPELQRRGLFRTEYEGKTLRENLGLPRPESRYVKRAQAQMTG